MLTLIALPLIPVLLGPPANPGLAPIPVPSDVLVVDSSGAGDFQSLQAAIDAAGDGDTLLIKPGAYGPSEVRFKGLQLVADGAPVNLNGGLRIVDTLVQHEILVRGIRIHGENLFESAPVPAVEVSFVRGPLRFEECEILGATPGKCWVDVPFDCAGGPGAEIELGLDVAFARCVLVGGDGIPLYNGGENSRAGNALFLKGGVVALHHCSLQGGEGIDWILDLDEGGPGGDGIYAEDGLVPATVFLAGSDSTGGEGGDGALCICEGGAGGDGLHMEGPAAQAFVVDSALIGDTGGCGGNGAPDGLPERATGGAQITQWSGPAPRLEGPGPLREGESAALSLEAAPGSLAILVGSPSPGLRLLPFRKSAALFLPGLATYELLGQVPVGGVLQYSSPIGQLPSGVQSYTLVTQAWVRPPVGVARLSGPWHRIVLDESL